MLSKGIAEWDAFEVTTYLLSELNSQLEANRFCRLGADLRPSLRKGLSDFYAGRSVKMRGELAT
jgi:hypothetical protein